MSESGWQGAWNLVILEDITEADALGYHELTPEGLPVGFVGVEQCRSDDVPWTSVLCHEGLEQLADPFINLTAENAKGVQYAYESCDAVESQSYEIDGVVLSNFVYPEWFSPDLVGHEVRVDQLRTLSAPFQLAPGGYIPVKKPGGSWTQIWGDSREGPLRAHAYTPHDRARRYRRINVPREEWRRSVA